MGRVQGAVGCMAAGLIMQSCQLRAFCAPYPSLFMVLSKTLFFVRMASSSVQKTGFIQGYNPRPTL
jgi:hypothetical protein